MSPVSLLACMTVTKIVLGWTAFNTLSTSTHPVQWDSLTYVTSVNRYLVTVNLEMFTYAKFHEKTRSYLLFGLY